MDKYKILEYLPKREDLFFNDDLAFGNGKGAILMPKGIGDEAFEFYKGKLGESADLDKNCVCVTPLMEVLGKNDETVSDYFKTIFQQIDEILLEKKDFKINFALERDIEEKENKVSFCYGICIVKCIKPKGKNIIEMLKEEKETISEAMLISILVTKLNKEEFKDSNGFLDFKKMTGEDVIKEIKNIFENMKEEKEDENKIKSV